MTNETLQLRCFDAIVQSATARRLDLERYAELHATGQLSDADADAWRFVYAQKPSEAPVAMTGQEYAAFLAANQTPQDDETAAIRTALVNGYRAVKAAAYHTPARALLRVMALPVPTGKREDDPQPPAQTPALPAGFLDNVEEGTAPPAAHEPADDQA